MNETERMVSKVGWKTNGGGKLHRLGYRNGRALCGQWISEIQIPYSEFWNMARCRKCFPRQTPPQV